MVLVMRGLHSVTAFCSTKVWSLLLFLTQALPVSQQASQMAGGPGLAAERRQPESRALRSPAGTPGAG